MLHFGILIVFCQMSTNCVFNNNKNFKISNSYRFSHQLFIAYIILHVPRNH